MSEFAPTADGPRLTALLLQCIDFISDTLLITEASPIDEPGPRVVFVNRAFERMTGYAASEIVGRSPRMLQGPATDRAELRRIRAALDAWEPVRAELVNYRASGEAFTVEMDIVPIAAADGRWTHWVSIQRDVSARKQAEAEAQARTAQHYESLATLSNGIAHDFNNIVAAILGNVAIGTSDVRAGRMPGASLEQIGKAAVRARDIIAKILAFARRRPDEKVPLQLAAVVLEGADLLRAILPAGVLLEMSVPETPLWVRGDSSQLCQVVLNLCVNALQALHGRGGCIGLRLAPASEPADALSAAEKWASIEVSDTGCGMDAATRARMFEPYFTTKQEGHGTGLGLSMVWGIVTAHKGALTVDSAPDCGSRIQLSLPLMPTIPTESTLPVVAPPSGARSNGDHVLVVDDDEVVVAMLEGMLQRWGFRVTSLQDPLQAVRMVRAAPNDFDAVVTDLNMPHLSGLQLASEMLAIRGDLPVILGSGHVDEDLMDAASRLGIAAVFPKEFAVEQLGTLITANLGRPRLKRFTSGSRLAAITAGDSLMQTFLINNRNELIARCRGRVALRPSRTVTDDQMAHGVPLFRKRSTNHVLARRGASSSVGQPKAPRKQRLEVVSGRGQRQPDQQRCNVAVAVDAVSSARL